MWKTTKWWQKGIDAEVDVILSHFYANLKKSLPLYLLLKSLKCRDRLQKINQARTNRGDKESVWNKSGAEIRSALYPGDCEH